MQRQADRVGGRLAAQVADRVLREPTCNSQQHAIRRQQQVQHAVIMNTQAEGRWRGQVQLPQ